MPVRDVNLAFDTIEGEMQEARRDINRSHKAPFGSEGGVFSAEDIGNAQSYAEIALAAAQQAQLSAYGVIPNRAALKAVDTTKQQYATISQEGGRNGSFVWQTGNYSAQVAADTSEGIYVKANAVPANLGAWVRQAGFNVAPTNVKWFGAVGDGIADDTVAIIAAKSFASAHDKYLEIPGGNYKITAPIPLTDKVGFKVFGTGMHATRLFASGNFSGIFTFNDTSLYMSVEGLSLDTTGTTTRCAFIGLNATVIRFSGIYFRGNLTGDLVYSNGQNIDFDKCTFQVDAAATWGVNFDCYNQNSGIIDCRVGGIGQGFRITNALTPGLNRVEGVKFNHNYFVNTGLTNIQIGNSLLTLVSNCVCDQATSIGIEVRDGANSWSIENNWIGGRTPFTGACVYVAETAGAGGIISGNHMGFNTYGVVVNATVALRVSDIVIANNVFQSISGNCLLLDSVINCTVTGNRDTGAPATGSWNTKGTFGAGSYTFDNNRWHTAAPAIFHAASSYRWGDDTGIVGKIKGSSPAGSGASSLVVAHGLFRIPSHVLVQPKYTTGVGTWFTNTYSNSQFTITWSTPTPDANCVWHWEATV